MVDDDITKNDGANRWLVKVYDDSCVFSFNAEELAVFN